jgi:hypothetical protein
MKRVCRNLRNWLHEIIKMDLWAGTVVNCQSLYDAVTESHAPDSMGTSAGPSSLQMVSGYSGYVLTCRELHLSALFYP